jgi:hypothetical protein
MFKSDFVHQITGELLRIKTDGKYASLIASVMTQKLRLMYTQNSVIDVETEYTQLLLDSIAHGILALKISLFPKP